MKKLAEIYAKYKSPDCHSGSDKGTVHSYIEVYEEIFASYHRAVRVLEIGILTGDSLRVLEEYFNISLVYGVDLCDRPLDLADLRPMIAEGTHHIRLFNAADPVQVEQNFPEDGIFDVVIEDASHTLPDQLAIYANFKKKMSHRGVYIIEDIADIDATRHHFEKIDPDKRVQIIDRRAVKNRYDDVLVVIGGIHNEYRG